MSVTADQRIPFQDLGRLHRSVAEELEAATAAVIESSAFVGAGPARAFEEAFAEAHGRAHAVGCGSGTDALALALRALGVGPGDEVVVPSMTFVATAEAVVHVGATPVLADVDPVTGLLDEPAVAAVRTERTRAVLPVHLYGHLVPFGTLGAWRDQGLLVVEDAAQAHLGRWNDHPVGSVGHAACFSFYPGKNLGGFGDGGAIVTDDDAVADRIRRLRDHGRTSKYLHEDIGWCSRLDGLQAAVLGVKLAHLPTWTAARQVLADHYRHRIGGLLVPWESGAVHHLLVVRVPAQHRDDVASFLNGRGIATGYHYPVPLSLQPSLSAWSTTTPHAERLATEVLSLPMDPLMTIAEVDRVADALLEALERCGP